MHNVSDQQVSQMAQRTTKFAVEVLPAGVGRDLGRKTRQKPSEGLRPVALQKEEVLELVYDSLDDLALSGCPPAHLLWPRPLRVVLRGCSHHRSVLRKPMALPLNRGEALVGEVGRVAVFADEDFSNGPFVGGGFGQAEGGYDALGGDSESHLEAVDPFGLRGAPSKGGLSREKSMATRPHPHHSRYEGGVQNVVDRSLPGEGLRHIKLEGSHLALQSPRPAIELALGGQRGEILPEVGVGEAPEIPLAPEARPLGEDGQCEYLRVGDERWTTNSGGVLGVSVPPPLFDEDVQ